MNRFRRLWSRRQWRERLIVWAYGLFTLVACLVFVSSNQTAERFSRLVFDSYQRFQPRAESGAPIVLVDIDEASIAKFGQWPWARTTLASLVDRLNELGAAAIAFDMVFPESDRTSVLKTIADLREAGASVSLPAGFQAVDNDHRLASAFQGAPVVAGIAISDETAGRLPAPKAGYAFGGTDPKTYLRNWRGGVSNLDVLNDAAKGIGFFSFPPSPDGIIRQIPLIANVQGQLYPALSIEALRVAQGAGALILRTTGSSGEVDSGETAITALKAGAYEISTDARGSIWIYYSGLPNVTSLSAMDVISADGLGSRGDLVNGAIVIVGTSAVGLRDLVATPIAASMPGMRVHAEILDQILSGAFLQRPDWMKGAEVAAALVFGLILLAFGAGRGSLVGSAVAVGLIAITIVASWYAFSWYHVLLDPVLPSAAVASVFGVTMPVLLLLTSKEKKFVRSAFSHYLAPSLVERLADNPSMLSLGGEMRELTVLFCDIRGFTSMSENLDPQSLTTLLNDFLTPMSDVLLRSEATIDKYMGDAIMAFWNAPLTIENHRRRACLAALDMTVELAKLNERSGRNLRIGIGINAGDCCVGNLGSSQRFNYSAIGDGVNVASRVEGLCKVYGLSIVLTESACSGVDDLAVLPIDVVRVAGRSEPVKIYTIIGDADFALRSTYRLLLAAHVHFLQFYRLGDISRARAALNDAVAVGELPLAPLHALYESRLSALQKHHDPTDWDGIFVAQEK